MRANLASLASLPLASLVPRPLASFVLLPLACAPSLRPPGADDDTADDDGDDDTADDDSDDDADDDDAIDQGCDAGPTDAGFYLCPDDPARFPWGERQYGRFTAWGDGAAVFVGVGGDETRFTLEWTGALQAARTPLGWPAVSFILDGTCGGRENWQLFHYYVADDEDALIGAFGNTLPASLPGVEVRQEASTCAADAYAWCGCADRCQPDDVVFDGGPSGTWRVPQGQEVVEQDLLHFLAWTAHTRIDLTCADVPVAPALWGVWIDIEPRR